MSVGKSRGFDEMEIPKLALENAIETYGAKHQMIVAIEELSELQKELCKHLRFSGNRDNISEEIADVYIVLEQLILIFNNSEDVERQVEFKLDRLGKTIEDTNRLWKHFERKQ